MRASLLPLATALLVGCGRSPAVDPVILALGGEEVRRSDFERYVSNVEARQGGRLEPTVRVALLANYLEKRVLVLQARSRGFVEPNAERAAGAGTVGPGAVGLEPREPAQLLEQGTTVR